jgi:acyl-CoA thioesterase-1
MKTIRLVLFCLLATGLAINVNASAQDASKKKKRPARKPNPAMAKVTDVPGLPRVLLIGDSISIGYTVPVRELLKGKANVHRPLTNCGPTTKGVTEIDKWLGDGKWDVIHFNFGLHDLKYLSANGKNLANPEADGSHQQVPIDKYEENLKKLVARLKKTNAKLIWRSTTPVPDGAKGRVVGDSAKYNAVAKKIMDENGIAIDDQYKFALGKLKKIQLPANVHFSKDGSKELAQQAVASIQKALSE